MWIENVAMDDVKHNWHHDCGPNSMLIQIVDPCMTFPTPKHNFKEIHQFEFLDVELNDGFVDDVKCTQEKADQLVDLLRHAYDNKMNVVVHCVAGICRSGAVVEVGTMMGFQAVDKYRAPNLLVKHRMMRALGFAYDLDEGPLSNSSRWGD